MFYHARQQEKRTSGKQRGMFLLLSDYINCPNAIRFCMTQAEGQKRKQVSNENKIVTLVFNIKIIQIVINVLIILVILSLDDSTWLPWALRNSLVIGTSTVEISILYEIIFVPPWLWEFFAVKNFSTYKTQKSNCKQYERVAARTRTIFRPPNKVNLIFI